MAFKRKFKNLFAVLLACVMLLSFLPAGALADSGDSGSPNRIAISVEKFTLGQGYHTEPLWVDFQPGETLDDIFTQLIGEGNYRASYDYGFYLTGLKDSGNTEPNPPGYILEKTGVLSDRTEEGWLQAGDFYGQSGWTYIVNGCMATVGMSDYIPLNGEVVRVVFSIYGYGSDVVALPPEWGGSLRAYADYDQAILVLADFNGNPQKVQLLANTSVVNAYNELMTKATDLTVSQSELDAAVAEFSMSVAEAEDELRKAEAIQDILTVVSTAYQGSGGYWEAVAMSAYGEASLIDGEQLMANALSLYKNNSAQATDYAKAILGLTSIGLDASALDDGQGGTADFLAKLYHYKATDANPSLGTINAYIYTLLAYDSGNYQLPPEAYWTREKLIDYMLANRYPDGAWGLAQSDPDVTAMAISALSGYRDDPNVVSAIDDAIAYLSGIQTANGGFASWGTENSCSSSMVVIALASLGIDADKDPRFIKNGNSVIDALLRYKTDENDLKFEYQDASSNAMATEQGFRALVAYTNMLKAQKEYNIYIFQDFGGGPSPSVDKTQLQAKIAEADAIINDGYTASSWQNFLNALSSAKAVRDDQNTSQGQVESALNALLSAISGLTKSSGSGSDPGTPPQTNITVQFSLLGTAADGPQGTVNTLAAGNLTTWIAARSVTVPRGATVYDVFTKVLTEEGYHYEGVNSNYVYSITTPGGLELAEFTNGPNSGWMYTVNGTHPGKGLRDYVLEDGDVIIWHYSDDQTQENGTAGGGETPGAANPKPSNPNQPSTGEQDFTERNQQILAALESIQPEQLAAARLPDNTPAVDPKAGQPVILRANDGLQLVIPAGALSFYDEPVRLVVEVGRITTAPQAEPSALVLDPAKYQRQIELHSANDSDGMESANFSAPVILTFPIDFKDLPEGIKTDQLAIYWWNPDRKDWIKLGGIYDPQINTLSITTYHFSTYAVMADTSTTPKRIAGNDRFLTAVQAAGDGWKAGADHVVLVNAYVYADALAAVPLAYKYHAPILLTDAGELTPVTLECLKKLNPRKVTIIGGAKVVSPNIQNQLNQLYGAENVMRYGGNNRYDTAALIAKALGSTGQAVLVNGGDNNYADALAISSYAAYHGIPILFTESNALPEATAQALLDHKVSQTLVIGGDSVVSDAVYHQLPQAVRYGGRDRYETAVRIAESLELSTNKVYVATGLGFADALTAGNLAARTLSPLVLVDKEIPRATSDFLLRQRNQQTQLIVLGGEKVITNAQENALYGILNPSP